jgi:hypothetical protein
LNSYVNANVYLDDISKIAALIFIEIIFSITMKG